MNEDYLLGRLTGLRTAVVALALSAPRDSLNVLNSIEPRADEGNSEEFMLGLRDEINTLKDTLSDIRTNVR